MSKSVHFVDYFVLVGLDLPVRPSQNNADLVFPSTILNRVPGANIPEYSIPTSLSSFCFPKGVSIHRSKERCRSEFGFFCIPIEPGTLMYCVFLKFYEKFQSEEVFDMQNDTANNIPLFVKHAQTFHVPVVLCALSRSLFFPQMLQSLIALHDHALKGSKSRVSIEFEMSKLLYPLPIRPGNHSVRIAVGPSLLHFYPPPSGLLPQIGTTLRPCFSSMPLNSFLYIFRCILLEKRIVLLSQNRMKLFLVAEGLRSLLFPFVWHHSFFPVIPTSLVDCVVSSNMPLLIGVQVMEEGDISAFTRKSFPSLVVVNCDSGALLSTVECQPLNSSMVNSLKAEVEPILLAFGVSQSGSSDDCVGFNNDDHNNDYDEDDAGSGFDDDEDDIIGMGMELSHTNSASGGDLLSSTAAPQHVKRIGRNHGGDGVRNRKDRNSSAASALSSSKNSRALGSVWLEDNFESSPSYVSRSNASQSQIDDGIILLSGGNATAVIEAMKPDYEFDERIRMIFVKHLASLFEELPQMLSEDGNVEMDSIPMCWRSDPFLNYFVRTEMFQVFVGAGCSLNYASCSKWSRFDLFLKIVKDSKHYLRDLSKREEEYHNLDVSETMQGCDDDIDDDHSSSPRLDTYCDPTFVYGKNAFPRFLPDLLHCPYKMMKGGEEKSKSNSKKDIILDERESLRYRISCLSATSSGGSFADVLRRFMSGAAPIVIAGDSSSSSSLIRERISSRSSLPKDDGSVASCTLRLLHSVSQSRDRIDTTRKSLKSLRSSRMEFSETLKEQIAPVLEYNLVYDVKCFEHIACLASEMVDAITSLTKSPSSMNDEELAPVVALLPALSKSAIHTLIPDNSPTSRRFLRSSLREKAIFKNVRLWQIFFFEMMATVTFAASAASPWRDLSAEERNAISKRETDYLVTQLSEVVQSMQFFGAEKEDTHSLVNMICQAYELGDATIMFDRLFFSGSDSLLTFSSSIDGSSFAKSRSGGGVGGGGRVRVTPKKASPKRTNVKDMFS